RTGILRTMRIRALFVIACAALFVSCGSESKPTAPAEPARKAAGPRPMDESRRFPQANLIEAKVIEKELMGKPFMPGGTLAHFKKGKTEYDMFVAKLPTTLDAAILLPDWSKALAGSKLVPSFGGYFGQDGGRPVFVFSKGAWIAGIAGLPEKEADIEARTPARRVNWLPDPSRKPADLALDKSSDIARINPSSLYATRATRL